VRGRGGRRVRPHRPALLCRGRDTHRDRAGVRVGRHGPRCPGQSAWHDGHRGGLPPRTRISRIQDYRDSTTADVVSDVSYCYTKYVSGTTCPTPTASTDTSLLQYSVNNQTNIVSVYTYDAGDRLTKVTNDNGATYAYTYNGDGDALTGASGGAETYNPSNQITSAGHAYDGAGNTTATPGAATLAYNDAGQMTGAGPESLAYAGTTQDQVLSDGSATAITYGLAAQDGQPSIDSYTPSAQATDYVIRDQQGDPLGYVQDGAGHAYATDDLGSVTSVISTAGTVTAAYAYDPYGHLAATTGTGTTDNLIGYTGALDDPASTLLHLGDRWYNPAAGAFTSQDTNSYLDNPTDGNRYAYAADNPVNNTDPTGQNTTPADVCGLAVGFIGFTAGLVISAGLALSPISAGISFIIGGVAAAALFVIGAGASYVCSHTSWS